MALNLRLAQFGATVGLGGEAGIVRDCAVSIDFERAHVAQAERVPVSPRGLSIHERDEANEWM
jgi:hypothetical protein